MSTEHRVKNAYDLLIAQGLNPDPLYKSVSITNNGNTHVEEADGNWRASWTSKKSHTNNPEKGFAFRVKEITHTLETFIYPLLHSDNFFLPGLSEGTYTLNIYSTMDYHQHYPLNPRFN